MGLWDKVHTEPQRQAVIDNTLPVLKELIDIYKNGKLINKIHIRKSSLGIGGLVLDKNGFKKEIYSQTACNEYQPIDSSSYADMIEQYRLTPKKLHKVIDSITKDFKEYFMKPVETRN